MHVGALVLFEGPAPTRDEMYEHMESRLHLVPRYRQKLAFPRFEMGRPFWIDDPQFNLDYHVRQTALPAPGSEEQLRHLVGRIFSQRLDRSKPLWELWVVHGLEDGRFALISKTHHALVDGVAGVDISTVLFDLAPTPTQVESDRWTPMPEPSQIDLVAEGVKGLVKTPADLAGRALGALSRPNRTAGEVREAVEGIGEIVWAGLNPAPQTPLNVPIGPHRRVWWVRSRLADFKQIKDALGGTVNDVVLAVVAGALGKWLRSRGVRTEGLELRALVPVSIRADDEHGALGNRIAAMRGPLPVYAQDPVERLRIVRESMQHVKDSKQALGAEVITGFTDFAPPTLLAQASRINFSTRLFNLIVTNVPGPQFPLYLLGREMLELVPIAFLPEDHAVAIAIMSYNGKVDFGLLGDYDAMPDIESLGELIEEALAELLEAARGAGAATAPAVPTPALRTSTSREPYAARCASVSASRWASSARSPGAASTRGAPAARRSARAAASRPGSRAATVRANPRPARSAAMPAPIPRDAPVTRAVRAAVTEGRRRAARAPGRRRARAPGRRRAARAPGRRRAAWSPEGRQAGREVFGHRGAAGRLDPGRRAGPVPVVDALGDHGELEVGEREVELPVVQRRPDAARTGRRARRRPAAAGWSRPRGAEDEVEGRVPVDAHHRDVGHRVAEGGQLPVDDRRPRPASVGSQRACCRCGSRRARSTRTLLRDRFGSRREPARPPWRPSQSPIERPTGPTTRSCRARIAVGAAEVVEADRVVVDRVQRDERVHQPRRARRRLRVGERVEVGRGCGSSGPATNADHGERRAHQRLRPSHSPTARATGTAVPCSAWVTRNSRATSCADGVRPARGGMPQHPRDDRRRAGRSGWTCRRRSASRRSSPPTGSPGSSRNASRPLELARVVSSVIGPTCGAGATARLAIAQRCTSDGPS